MTEEAGMWNGNKLVVLSLFDGIGGIWAALTRLGIPFHGYSSEVVSTPTQYSVFPIAKNVMPKWFFLKNKDRFRFKYCTGADLFANLMVISLSYSATKMFDCTYPVAVKKDMIAALMS